MTLARVVTFDGVGQDRIDEIREGMEGAPPEGLNPTEMLVLHDPDAEQAMAIIFFDNEDDYRKGDAVLDAMPSGDTPGRRTSVKRYEVAIRMTP
jgi:hypothetical protein